MNNTRQRGKWLTALIAVAAATSGCQTWQAGMTLPSGRYLEHRPQYFPPDPDFPLTKEQATMAEQNALASRPAGPIGAAGVPRQAPPPVAAPGVPAGPAPGGAMAPPPGM